MSFDQAYALTVSPSVERTGWTCSASDPGNWTGGSWRCGDLLGTNSGISAFFLENLPETDPCHQKNPRLLTNADIQRLYKTYFWDAIQGDALHPTVAGLLFDCAVNQGQNWAPRCLQSALGVFTDGQFGPKTLAAAKAADPATLHAEIARIRDERYRADSNWHTDGVGWIRRLMTVVAATASFT